MFYSSFAAFFLECLHGTSAKCKACYYFVRWANTHMYRCRLASSKPAARPTSKQTNIALALQPGSVSFGYSAGLESGHPAGYEASHYLAAIVNQVHHFETGWLVSKWASQIQKQLGCKLNWNIYMYMCNLFPYNYIDQYNIWITVISNCACNEEVGLLEKMTGTV